VGLLDWMKNLGDPTKEWPAPPASLPQISRRNMQFDPPRFGEPLEALSVFGRPDVFDWHNRSTRHATLKYFERGMEVDVENGRFVGVTFYISDAMCPPKFRPVRPKGPDGREITTNTTREALIEAFGPPDPKGTDEEALVIIHGDTASDFLFDDDGKLDQWAVFIND
jgi:hypothetical protein